MIRALRCGQLLTTVVAFLSVGATQAQAEERHYPLFGAEIRVGTYDPVISTNSSVTAVRQKVFGPEKWPWQKPATIQLEFDVYPLNEVFDYGLPGVYVRAGFWHDVASSRICIRPGASNPQNPNYIIPCNGTTVLDSQRGNDSAAMTVVPVSLGLLYRFDVLRRNLDWPIVFSAKLGLDYMMWWGATGNGTAKLPNGQNAQGGNLGFSGSLSVALSLDAFTEKGKPQAYGVDKMGRYNYLFLEYSLVNGRYLFNNKPFIDLTDLTMLTLGISLDFV